MSHVSFETKLILVGLAILEWFLVWAIRFLPRPIKGSLLSYAIGIVMTAALLFVVVEGLLQYAAATGHVPLKHDKFFLYGFPAQHVISFVILWGSNRKLQSKGGPSSFRT